jgi:hypothetical protein
MAGKSACPPSKECLQSYICKPANYQPPALIELLFDNLIPRQGPNPAPKGQSPLTRFLFHQAFQANRKIGSSIPNKQGRNPAPKGQSPLTKGRRPSTRFLKRKALVPWCPRFGAGENLQGTESLVSLIIAYLTKLCYYYGINGGIGFDFQRYFSEEFVVQFCCELRRGNGYAHSALADHRPWARASC